MQVCNFLDRTLPLSGASHADVDSYTVEIPMRYAKCFAILKDGRKVEFAERREFCGWTGYNGKRSFLFKHDDLHIELRTDPEHVIGRNAPGHLRNIRLTSVSEIMENTAECSKYISVDGSQLLLAE